MSKPKILVARAIFPETIERLSQHFEIESNQADESWSKEQLIAKLQGKQGAFTTGSERIDTAVLDACPDLKICANMARRITESEHFLRAGKWQKWSFDMFAGSDIHGSTLGIIGMGRIGQGIARRGAHGFGMKVIYHNRSRLDAALEAECKASYVSKEELLKTADHVVLVVPYSPASHHTIGAAEIALMKPTATLVNIARGGIVDDAALAVALREKRIAAAGLDVFEGEPKVHPDLLTVPNVVLTPHIASATVPTRRAMADLAADNLIAWFSGEGALTPVTPVPPAHKQ